MHRSTRKHELPMRYNSFKIVSNDAITGLTNFFFFFLNNSLGAILASSLSVG